MHNNKLYAYNIYTYMHNNKLYAYLM